MEHTMSDLSAQVEALAGDIAALHERAAALTIAADHEPARNEGEALSLVDALAGVRDLLRRTESPLREAKWHVEHLDVMPTTYGQGHVAGYAEAVLREREGDATSGDDAATWFTASPGQIEVDQYERGWMAGFSEYFAGRVS
jgi:hypothetical protein